MINLKSIIKLLLKESEEEEQPKFGDESDPLSGFTTKKTGEEPDIHKTSWEVKSQPQALRFAQECRRMRLDLRYFEYLPDEGHYKLLKSEAASIVTSLSNAEGKLRQLHKDIQVIEKFKK